MDRLRLRAATKGLQWGRAPEGAERPAGKQGLGVFDRLQWGRAPEGAERLFSRRPGARCRRFNGAAPRRARRVDGLLARERRKQRLQWGRAPEGAER